MKTQTRKIFNYDKEKDRKIKKCGKKNRNKNKGKTEKGKQRKKATCSSQK